MRKLFITCIAVLFIAVAVDAQDYRTGIGFRGGYYNGLTVKHFLASEKAVEGLLVMPPWGGFLLTGLYEIHGPAFNVSGLNYYYGVGGHLGQWRGKTGEKHYNADKNYTVLGIDGILGIEYNFGELPFNVSLDFKPALNLTGGYLYYPDEFALSIRYVWGSR